MPTHKCLDPHDPYAEHEVLVEFEITSSGLRLVSVIDDQHDEILHDLIEPQREDLRRELALAGWHGMRNHHVPISGHTGLQTRGSQ